MTSRRKPTPVADVLKDVFKKLGTDERPSEETMGRVWREAAGTEGARHSKPVSLKRRVLAVSVDNSVWLQDLTLKKRKLLKALQRALGKDKIFQIHFRMGEL